jgi:hypothetical protein
MRPPAQWSARGVTALMVAWIAASGTALTLWLVAEARGFARAFAEVGKSLGATSMEIEVDLLGAWPQLLPLYAVVVLLPAAAFVLMWRRARRRASPIHTATTS